MIRRLSVTARRLVGYSVLFSSVIAVLTTGVQLYTDYESEVADIEEQLRLVEQSYAAGLSHALWVADDEMLTVQLEGVMHLPGVTWIAVHADEGTTELGVRPHQRVRTRDFALSYEHRGQDVVLGRVSVVADLDPVVNRLASRLLVILVTNTGKTLVVALFMLFIVRRLVTRHLDALADHVARIDAGHLTEPLRLDRPPLDARDELQTVVDSLNRMSENLHNRLAERDALELRLEALNRALEQRVRDLEEFSYSLAHDLATPLRTVLSFTEMLEDRLGETADADTLDWVRRIQGGAIRMKHLIESMLSLAVVGRDALTRVPIDLGALAELVVADLRIAEPERQVTLTTSPDLIIEGDRTLTRALLENLIGNSWRFTRARSPGHIEVGCRTGPDGRVCFVRDDGVGFDPAAAGRIFKPFQSAHARQEYGGSGIGLSIVRRVVERHGGQVWAEGEIDVGATIWFTLDEPPKGSTTPAPD